MVSLSVIGVGYVGLVTAAGLAHLGHDVTCIDVDVDRIEQLRQGHSPIFEAGLDQLIKQGCDADRLRFQAAHDDRSAANPFHFLCVPTPAGVDGLADLSYLEQAAATLGPVVVDGAIVINKSTVPIGSTRVVNDVMQRPNVTVVSNPEFLREGSAVQDFLHPDRIVIGSDDRDAAGRVAALYDGLDTEILLTDPSSAELVKYAANSFLATKLSFVNTVATLCEEVGADIDAVRRGIGLDHRIGLDYFSPGPGWGGSCFPKDTLAMVRIAEQVGHDFALVRAAIAANDQQFDRVAAKALAQLTQPLSESTIAVLGLAFKAGTDDTRMSPALAVIERLLSAGVGRVRAYDPVATLGEENPLTGFEQVDTVDEAAENADVLVVMTEWQQFETLDVAGLAAVMAGTTIIDTRNVVDVSAANAAGLRIVRLGRAM